MIISVQPAAPPVHAGGQLLYMGPHLPALGWGGGEPEGSGNNWAPGNIEDDYEADDEEEREEDEEDDEMETEEDDA